MFTFKYCGWTFRPVGRIDSKMSFKTGLIHTHSAAINDFMDYNYNNFYNAATPLSDRCDVFYCEESGNYYTPGEEELFQWRGPFEAINVDE